MSDVDQGEDAYAFYPSLSLLSFSFVPNDIIYIGTGEISPNYLQFRGTSKVPTLCHNVP